MVEIPLSRLRILSLNLPALDTILYRFNPYAFGIIGLYRKKDLNLQTLDPKSSRLAS